MLFNSYIFIFVFLPLVVGIYALVRKLENRSWSIGLLVIASLFYYSWWKPEFLTLLIFSVTVNYFLGKYLINKNIKPNLSKIILICGIIFNIALLFYFKYTMFFMKNINDLFGADLSIPQIILPIGISFITFQKIAFLVDAHIGRVGNFSFKNYALFVTFFPQLIAGPIVHHSEMMPQFDKKPSTNHFHNDLSIGVSIFIIGLFKKVVIADSVSVYADAGYGTIKSGLPLDFVSSWITVISYSLQLYFDFSGYSDMAVGIARIFGIRLPVNFHSPYKSESIIEFWRRWHMTLSRFLRDYIYIPLGGNRVGSFRQTLNITLVMLIGGLWHGANWTFVLWGGIHGVMLTFNHGWNQTSFSKWKFFDSKIMKIIFVFLTFILVSLAWIPFRAESISDALKMFNYLFIPGNFDIIKISLLNFINAQTAIFYDLKDIALWFKPRELWPSPLPADFISSQKPVAVILFLALLITFIFPNTHQYFGIFQPVSGLSSYQLIHRGTILALNKKIAFLISAIFVFSILQLSRVRPFLYFQF